MRDSASEAERWLRQAENDLMFGRLALQEGFFHQACFVAGLLDQYYVAARYPNGLPGGAPFEAFSRAQAEPAIAAAERFVSLAVARIRGGH